TKRTTRAAPREAFHASFQALRKAWGCIPCGMRSGLVAIGVLVLASCGGSGSGGDAGHDTMPSCTSDPDCEAGMYCTGPSACVPGVGCVAGTPPCAAGQLCSESAHTCTTDCGVTGDADSDGHRAMLCGGDDCDDSDPNAYPGNGEVCDTANHDE